jgi:hypothetical protein
LIRLSNPWNVIAPLILSPLMKKVVVALTFSTSWTARMLEGRYSSNRRVQLFDNQARHEGRLSELRREASSPLYSEFDLRYSNRVALGVNDGERADIAINGAAGKRLTYRQAN